MPAGSTKIDEYIAVIKPSFDSQAWEQVSGQIKTTLSKPFSFISEQSSLQLDLAKRKLERLDAQRYDLLEKVQIGDKDSEDKFEEADKKYLEQQKVVEQLTEKTKKAKVEQEAFADSVASSVIYLGLLSVAINKAKDAALDMAENASEISNQFLNQSSVFVDTDTRNIMAKFGVNAPTAQSLSVASQELGIDFSDYSKLTYGQRKAFSKLMAHYQTGIESIDTEKLERFNKATQQYQLIQAKLNVTLQTNLTKLYAESDGVKEVMNTLSETMESIDDILTSDAVQKGFNFMMDIINGILKFATTPINWLGGIFGGGNTTNTTNNKVTTNTTINTNSGVNPEQLAIDIGLQVQNALSRG